ncbi:MAG: T9SS type A sorting domain-containing protein [Bacteroidota bacterium]
MKASQNGNLVLSSMTPDVAQRIRIVPTNELPPSPPETEIPIHTSQIPTEFTLAQNFPNPFNPSTTIIYTLPVDARVTLDVYDVIGQHVAQLVDGTIVAGYHDAVFDASTLSSGLYFYRLTAVGADGILFTRTEKMILTK